MEGGGGGGFRIGEDICLDLGTLWACLDAGLCQQISFRIGYEARRRLSLDDGRRQANRGRREWWRSCGREWRRVWDRDTQHLAEIVQGPEDLGEVEA